MESSLHDTSALLQKWHNAGQLLTILFTDASDPSASWRRSGKVVDVIFTKFGISWGNDETQYFVYHTEASISDDESSLFLRYDSGDSLVMYEERT